MTRSMPIHSRAMTITAVSLALIAVAQPRPAVAQDVLIQGREAGVPPPAEILRILAEDTTAFRFERVWKQKAAAVWARRIEIEALLGARYTAAQLAGQGASLTGVLSVPVIPALYSDKSAPYTPAEYQERLFGNGSGAVSVSRLYSEMSRDVFTVSGGVLPWLNMPQATSYYEDGTRFGKVADFLLHALERADSVTDFGQYDNDGMDGVPNSGDDDGYVDVAAFIYPTVAVNCGRGGTGIWPHRWAYRWAQRGAGRAAEPFYTDDASANGGLIRVDDYIIQSGLYCDGRNIMGTGTISHELGHGIDLPDLYDTDREDGTYSQGIGYWGLMGAGGWNEQTSPAHMSAWSKDRLGWLTVSVVDQFATPVSLSSVQQSGSVVRINNPDPSSNEYFLLANRQLVGSDEYLRQPGVLIWHIDPDQIDSRISSNEVNADANHKGVDLEEADGQDDLDYGDRRNAGDAGDPFPGSTRKTAFTAGSYPSSHTYSRGSSCTVGVRSIRLAGSVAYFDVNASERIRMLGDANGDLQVDRSDVNETNWYALGYRGGTIQLDEADVDGDGDVDIRDGFLIHSHYAGYSVPVSGIGSLEVVECDPLASHIAAVEASTESGVEAVAAKGAVKRGGSR